MKHPSLLKTLALACGVALSATAVSSCSSTLSPVKAADRISAYVKCLEEYGFGNREFLTAQENVRASVSQMNMPEAEDFMREFAPSFMLPLDALN